MDLSLYWTSVFLPDSGKNQRTRGFTWILDHTCKIYRNKEDAFLKIYSPLPADVCLSVAELKLQQWNSLVWSWTLCLIITDCTNLLMLKNFNWFVFWFRDEDDAGDRCRPFFVLFFCFCESLCLIFAVNILGFLVRWWLVLEVFLTLGSHSSSVLGRTLASC